MELFNVYERHGSGGNGLNRLNARPVTREKAETIITRMREARANRFSRSEIFYIIRPYRKPNGVVTNSVRTY